MDRGPIKIINGWHVLALAFIGGGIITLLVYLLVVSHSWDVIASILILFVCVVVYQFWMSKKEQRGI